MPGPINPLEHPICLERPQRLAASHWAGHLPFAMWLTAALRPRVVVELGTYLGTSYCGFCQAIATLGLAARSYAVDTWKGDPHNGSNGPEILADLRRHHDPRYGHFSRLLVMTFDEAAPKFAAGEIDLLHIDGYHTYDTARHDFEVWRPKVSEQGVILLHDVAERKRDFGVWKLWDELTREYPSFAFEHDHGLGLLAVGRELPESIQRLVLATAPEAELLRKLFERLGEAASGELELATARTTLSAIEDAVRQVLTYADSPPSVSWGSTRLRREAGLARAIGEEPDDPCRPILHVIGQRIEWLKRELAARENQELRLQERLAQFESELEQQESSLAWKIARKLSRVIARVAPAGSRRRRLIRGGGRVLEIAYLEGPAAAARRLARRAIESPLRRCENRNYPETPWAHDQRPVFLLVHHAGGGGTTRHVNVLAERLYAERVRPVLLAPEGTGLRWEEFAGQGSPSPWVHLSRSDPDSIAATLHRIRPCHAHLHGLFRLPWDLVDQLAQYEIPYDWTVHDYFPICPRGHLQRNRFHYCCEPEPPGCDACLSLWGDFRGEPVGESIRDWRARFEKILRSARRVFVPSRDVERRLGRYFPKLPLTFRPHPEAPDSVGVLAERWKPGETVRVAVVGTMVGHKGSRILLACARSARRLRQPIEYVVFGETDCNAALRRPGNVRITGRYAEDEIYDRLAATRCHLAFLPTPVPETHQYVLSIVMRARLYCVCFDLGAQAERLQTWGWGRTIPLGTSPEEINATLRQAAEAVANLEPPSAPQFPTYSRFLESYYELDRAAWHNPSLGSKGQAESAVPPSHLQQRNGHARLH